jgi:hypothetical protein
MKKERGGGVGGPLLAQEDVVIVRRIGAAAAAAAAVGPVEALTLARPAYLGDGVRIGGQALAPVVAEKMFGLLYLLMRCPSLPAAQYTQNPSRELYCQRCDAEKDRGVLAYMAGTAAQGNYSAYSSGAAGLLLLIDTCTQSSCTLMVEIGHKTNVRLLCC